MSEKTYRVILLATTIATTASFQSARAHDFEVGDLNVSLVGSVTAGFGLRLLDQSSDLVGVPGTGGFLNDTQSAHAGDLNYKSGNFFAGYLKANAEILIKTEDNYKFFVRGAGLYDFAATNTEFTPLPAESKDAVARDAKLYDLWVSKDFEIGGRNSRLRIGNQVVSWGESLFVQGGINQTNPIDLQRYTLPGVPLKEVVLPTPMISFATSPVDDINIEAYYEFAWNGNRLVPSGTYFSTADYSGPGRTPVWFSWDPAYAALNGGAIVNGKTYTNPQAAQAAAVANGYSFTAPDGSLAVGAPFFNDRKPPDQGQFGVSAHYKPPGADIDFGVYFERYHDKNAYLSYLPNGSLPSGFNAQWVYPQDETLFGVSTNFALGDWAIGLELSYRPDDPILVNPFTCGDLGGAGPDCHGNYNTYRKDDRLQAHLTWWRNVNPNDTDVAAWLVRHAGAQSSNIQGEFVEVHYGGVKNHTYQGLGLYADLSTNLGAAQQYYGDGDSYGFVAYFDLTYDSTLLPGWQVVPNVTFSVGIKGDTPNANYTWFEGVRSTTLAVNFTRYPPDWTFQLQYVTYDGGDPTYVRNYFKDRDWFGMQVTRNF